jgi:hypothetical protein
MGQRAGITHNGAELSRRSAALLWLAVACVSLMPSIYRGGAEVPHAHSFFQFWFSGPEAAFDHHHEHGAGMAAEHEHPPLEAVDSRCGALVDYAAFSCPAPAPGSSAAGARDEAKISPAVPPGGVVDSIVVTALTALIALLPAVRRWRFPLTAWSWLDRRLSPESPPPRSVTGVYGSYA